MKDLKFIHITKTAGTSIENEANKLNIHWGRFHKEYGWWHEIFKHKSVELKEMYDWFMVVRNPYDRILSEFHCVWGGIGGSSGSQHITNQRIEMSSKETFNNFLISRIKNCYLRVWHANGVLGDHYTPQYEYLDVNNKVHVLKMENLDKDFQSLMDQYKLPVKLNSKDNVTNKKFTIDDMNPQLKDLIKRTYERDFELFEYKL